jgi:hypothetical protein
MDIVRARNQRDLDSTNPFARAVMDRACLACERVLPPESFPLPSTDKDGYLIVPNVCLACHAESERNRRIAAKEPTA